MTTSTEKLIKDVMLNVKANHPVTVVYSDDPNDTLSLLKSSMNIIREKTDKMYYWTATKRWTDISSKDKSLAELIAQNKTLELNADQNKTPLALCFSAPEQLPGKAKNPVFFVSLLSAQFKNENIGMLQELRDFDYLARNGVNDSYRIVILANSSFEIPSDYENIFGIVRHESHTIQELSEVYKTDFMKEYIEKVLCTVYQGKPETLLEQFNNLEDYCVNTLNGLSARQVRLILYKAVSSSVLRTGAVITGVDFEKFKEFIYNKKFEEISRTGILTLLKPTPMTDVGGFHNVKTWLEERRWAFTDEAAQLHIDPPKGMALLGPPGTGKTWIARATADTLQFPCLQFNVDAVFNKWVGDSEKNMTDALKTIEAMAPCVLFVDEIDKVFSSMAGGGQGGDSGVTARVFGKLLTWMQDNKSKIFVIVTANRIQNIPSEFLRKGRLDEIWCVDFPTSSERKEIFDIHLSKRGQKIDDLSKLLEVTDDYSSSEIEYIVKEGVTQAGFRKETLSVDHLVSQAKLIVPTATAFKEDIDRMKTWAKTHARMASRPEVVEAAKEQVEI